MKAECWQTFSFFALIIMRGRRFGWLCSFICSHTYLDWHQHLLCTVPHAYCPISPCRTTPHKTQQPPPSMDTATTTHRNSSLSHTCNGCNLQFMSCCHVPLGNDKENQNLQRLLSSWNYPAPAIQGPLPFTSDTVWLEHSTVTAVHGQHQTLQWLSLHGFKVCVW